MFLKTFSLSSLAGLVNFIRGNLVIGVALLNHLLGKLSKAGLTAAAKTAGINAAPATLSPVQTKALQICSGISLTQLAKISADLKTATGLSITAGIKAVKAAEDPYCPTLHRGEPYVYTVEPTPAVDESSSGSTDGISCIVPWVYVDPWEALVIDLRRYCAANRQIGKLVGRLGECITYHH
eukprot:scaffold2017_cov181-Ochromonas_danica.AAC.3